MQIHLQQQALWNERDYPRIDWERIPAQVYELRGWLNTCLAHHDVPIFRDRYIRKRPLRKPNAGLVDSGLPSRHGAYYGPRVERIM